MSLSDLASLGSFVSGIAVLISLIYLSLQIRQNTKHSRASIHQARIMRAWEFNMRLADKSTSLSQTWLAGERADQGMSEKQLLQYLCLCRAVFLAHEDSYRQHRVGLYEEPAYEGSTLVMKNRFSSPGMRAAWRVWRETFGSDYQTLMDDLVHSSKVTVPSHVALREAFAEEPPAMVGSH